MKRYLLFTISIFTFLLACENDILQDDLSINPTENEVLQGENMCEPLSNYDGTAFLPEFENIFSGNEVDRIVRYLDFQLDGTTRYLQVSVPCGAYTDVIWEGEGMVTHLGKSFFYAHYLSLDCTNPVLPITGTLTNHKGDELHLMMYYSTAGAIFNHYQDWIVYGGTGEYKNATGELSIVQKCDKKDQTVWNLTGSGIIAYCN